MAHKSTEKHFDLERLPAEGETERLNAEEVSAIALVLIYATAWEEGKGDFAALRSWRSYDWDALDYLREIGLIDFNNRSKSVLLTDKGAAAARELLGSLSVDTDALARAAECIESAQPAAPEEGRVAYELDVCFKFSELACWRKLVVPADCTFFDLHFVLQTLFNWLDYHVYDFEYEIGPERFFLGEVKCFESGFFDDTCEWRGATLCDIEDVKLSDVFSCVGEVRYEYDWGDGWEIDLALIRVINECILSNPRCIDGAGDSPPDDVGGEGGFKKFLEVIADTKDSEHVHMEAWGQSQGFERFDMRRVNNNLKNWRKNKELHLANREKHQESAPTGDSFPDE